MRGWLGLVLLSACVTARPPAAPATAPLGPPGAAEHERGDLDGAIDAARRALLEQEHAGRDAPELRFILAAWLKEAGRTEEALSEYLRVRGTDNADLARRAEAEIQGLTGGQGGARPPAGPGPESKEAPPELRRAEPSGAAAPSSDEPQEALLPEASAVGPVSDPSALLARARMLVASGRIREGADAFALLAGTALADQAETERLTAVNAWVQAERDRAGREFVEAKKHTDPASRRRMLEAARDRLQAALRDFPESSWAPRVRENLLAVERYLATQTGP